MKRKTLTAAGVARVRPPADPRRRRMDWDAVVPGLALRTTANGSKSWVLVTRAHGRVRFVTLGKSPGIELKTARDLAREGLERVARGEDPRIPNCAPVRVPGTFAAVAPQFVTKWSKTEKRTWKEDERILTKYVLPAWAARRLDSIERTDVTALLDGVKDAHGPIMANRTQAVISKLYSWALDEGLARTHPVVRLRRRGGKEKARDRVLATAEIRTLWATWETMGYPWGTALQLLLLTAARRGEIEEMAWSEIDLDAQLWTVPAERVKTNLPLLIPLPGAAVELLAGVPRFDGCDFVLTTTTTGPIRAWSDAVEDAREKSGINGWRIHDLRRTTRTGMAQLGIASDVAERVLGHTVPGVRGVYDRYAYLSEKRDALERWAAHVTALVARDA